MIYLIVYFVLGQLCETKTCRSGSVILFHIELMYYLPDRVTLSRDYDVDFVCFCLLMGVELLDC